MPQVPKTSTHGTCQLFSLLLTQANCKGAVDTFFGKLTLALLAIYMGPYRSTV